MLTEGADNPVVHVSGSAGAERQGLPVLYSRRMVDFGVVDMGQTKDTVLPDLIVNDFAEPMTIDTMYLSGDDIFSFSLEGYDGLPIPLESGAGRGVGLSFSPSIPRTYHAVLVIGQGGVERRLPIVGVSRPTWYTDVVDYGRVGVGISRDTTLYFEHVLDDELICRAIDLQDGDFSLQEVNPRLPATVGADGLLEVVVRYRPTKPGAGLTGLRLSWESPEGVVVQTERRLLTGRTPIVATVEEAPAGRLKLRPIPADDRLWIDAPGPGGRVRTSITVMFGRTVRTLDVDAGMDGIHAARYRGCSLRSLYGLTRVGRQAQYITYGQEVVMKRLLAILVLLASFACIPVQAQWKVVVEGGSFALVDVSFAGETAGYAVGVYGTVRRSVDGGKTWSERLTVPTTDDFRAVQAVSPDIAVAVMRDGDIWRTTNGGAPSGVGLIVGMTADWNDGVILRTTDAGLTWTEVVDPLRGQRAHLYRGADMFDAGHGCIVGSVVLASGVDVHLVCTTDDGGATWTVAYEGPRERPGFLTSVIMTSKSDIVAGGESLLSIPPPLLRSTDGGRTFVVLGHQAGTFVDAAMGPSGEIALAGNKVMEEGHIAFGRHTFLTSKDRGATWSPATSTLPNLQAVA
ncbi:MAG: hypothetical protein J0H30_12995, partial [Alphaproteobacteria bacterium]|nr:hypothetical protein [Alphaproteobacteria bacterium]